MQTFLVFNVQFTLALLVLGLLTRWYVLPALRRLPPHRALSLALLPGTTRFMGLTFLIGTVAPEMPAGFAIPAGLGDLASAILALIAVALCHGNARMGRSLAWLYVVLGGADLAVGLLLGFQYALWNHLGGMWTYIIFAFPTVVLSLFVSGRLLLTTSAASSDTVRAPA